tara:strand:+ start:158 stop:442 length:285 start_codon:yes stop_codon:yes gene_type:complete
VVEEIIVILLIMVKVTLVDSVEEEVETSHLLVVLEVGLVDVQVETGLVMVTVEVAEVPIIQDSLHKILKAVTQEQLVDNIKVTDTLRLLRSNEF